MALPIRQGATHKVVVGPVVEVGNGYVPVTTLALSTADEAEAILHDNGTVVDISAYTWAAIATADGYYHLTLQSGISGTVGHLTIAINDDSLCLPVRADFVVLEEAVYDQMYAAAAPGAATPAALATTDGKVDTINTNTAGLAGAAMRGTDSAYTGTPPTAAAIADQVWDEAKAGHVGVGSFGEEVQAHALSGELPSEPPTAAQIRAEIDSNSTMVAAIAGYLDTEIASIISALATAQADLDIITGANGVNLLSATQASIDAIEADTNELQGDLTDGGRLDLLIDIIVAATQAQGEPAQGAPPVSADIGVKIAWIYKLLRNKATTTGSTISLYDDAGTTVDAKITHSDDGTTYTKGEIASGP